jgi:hypothetical protein
VGIGGFADAHATRSHRHVGMLRMPTLRLATAPRHGGGAATLRRKEQRRAAFGVAGTARLPDNAHICSCDRGARLSRRAGVATGFLESRMSASADSYRAEADRCRRLAIACRDADAAQRWRALAQDYDELAKTFDAMQARIRTPAARRDKPAEP